MIGKVISGGSFGGTVGYVMKEQSRVLEARGVEPPGAREMVEDFEDQARLNPRLQQNVGHISLSFSPEDAPKLTDERMTQIAREYMQKMGITDTQYLLVRHLDQPHPHCHLVYNRVGDHGQTISDRNIKLRNAKVCRELTERFGLHLAPGKEAVRRERLREPDRTRYEIYDAIKDSLPKCRNWNELEGKLKEQGINVRYKYCGSTSQKQGILFSKKRAGVLRFEGRSGLQFLEVGSPLRTGATAAHNPDVGTQGSSRKFPDRFCRSVRRRASLLRSGRLWRRRKPVRRIGVARQRRIDSAAAVRLAICPFTRDDAAT